MQMAEREAQERRRDGSMNQRDEESGPNRSAAAKSAAAPLGSRQMGGLADGRGGPSKEKKESGNEVETRNISGRQFHREGTAWIDTAYQSSRATINVARGSEQFRALVADEPGIRAIADQLGGKLFWFEGQSLSDSLIGPGHPNQALHYDGCCTKTFSV